MNDKHFAPSIQTPSFATRLDVYEVERAHRKFWSLADKTHVRYRSQGCYPVFRPRSHVVRRSLPEAIIPLRSSGSGSHEHALEKFFSIHAPSGVAAWADGWEHYGSFAGQYSGQFRSWLDSELVFGRTCLVSLSSDVALVADRDLRFSVILAPAQLIFDLEDCFGGASNLRDDFIRYVESGDFGEGVEDAAWAIEELT